MSKHPIFIFLLFLSTTPLAVGATSDTTKIGIRVKIKATPQCDSVYFAANKKLEQPSMLSCETVLSEPVNNWIVKTQQNARLDTAGDQPARMVKTVQ